MHPLPTAGRPDAEAVRQAQAARVPVSAILFGTPSGRITLEDRELPVPASAAFLLALAAGAGSVA